MMGSLLNSIVYGVGSRVAGKAVRASLILCAAQALAQTNIPGRLHNANNQLNNWGDRNYLNPASNVGPVNASQRVGVYQNNNRYTDRYTVYPLDRGSGYVNGYGPFSNVGQLFPSRYSYDMHAPLYTPYKPYEDLNRDGIYASPYSGAPRGAYQNDPRFARPATPGSAANARAYGATPSANFNVPGTARPAPQIGSRVVRKGLTGAKVGAAPARVTLADYRVKGGELRCVGEMAGQSELVADVQAHDELTNLELTVIDAGQNLGATRATQSKGVSVKVASGSPLASGPFGAASGASNAFALAGDSGNRCASYRLLLPVSLRLNATLSGSVEGVGCTAPLRQLLSCKVAAAN